MDVDLSTNLAGIPLKNPVTVASGTFGFGFDFEKIKGFNNSQLGGIILKGTTLNPKEGNPPPRIVEVSGGIINSIGFQNPGIKKVLKEYLPLLERYDTKIILNISGGTIKEYGEVCKIIENEGKNVSAIEINVSCPNVKEGGIQFGVEPSMTAKVVREVKKNTSLPVIVKLSPLSNIVEISSSVIEEGGDAISLINTIPALAIDIKTKKPILGNKTGGLSGPAVKPIALFQIDSLYRWKIEKGKKFSILGMGGIVDEDDIIEFIMAGADAISLGTSIFVYEIAIDKIILNLKKKMKSLSFFSIKDMVGAINH